MEASRTITAVIAPTRVLTWSFSYLMAARLSTYVGAHDGIEV